MKPWRSVLVVLSALAVLTVFAAPAAAQDTPPFYVASESYYRLDVPAGSIGARVEAKVQTGAVDELEVVSFWAMPGARDIVVSQGDTVLKSTSSVSDEYGNPTIVNVTLAEPLRGKLTVDLVMTYTVPAQSTDAVKSEAGAIEAIFVSQGPGSFVLIDVPLESDYFVEPGCVEAATQPGEVSSAGFLRFVCGETVGLAVSGDDDGAMERCAQLADSCRQRVLPGPYIGFAQSITDPAKQLILQADVEMAGGIKPLSFKYFRANRAWAEQQFETAKAALPLLEEMFGFAYPNDKVLLRESNLIGVVGAAGIAFTDRGEMLITNTGGSLDDRGVTVHELAHQWATIYVLEEPFASEGLAEWASDDLASRLGYGHRDWEWESLGYTDPLATWRVSSSVTNGYYWYGRSAAFWDAFEQAVGGRANMSAVLGQIDDTPKVRDLDAQWFQDRGEEVSGANLDELFLSWVYVRDTATPLLVERRAAHDAVAPLRERAASMLLTGIPRDIQANLDDWVFQHVAAQVTEANALLDEYAALLARAAQDGGVGAGLGARWNELTMAEVTIVLNQMEQALDAIADSTNRLTTGVDDPEGRAALERARERFLAGEYAEAKALAAGASSISYNKDAAEKLIAIGQERAANYDPNFLQKIGLFGSDPSDNVTAAESAYAAGDYVLALEEVTSAIDAWSGAQEKGLFRLSLVVFGMFGLVIGGWFLIRRLDNKKAPRVPAIRREGHVLTDPGERTSSWQEWLNQKNPPGGPQ